LENRFLFSWQNEGNQAIAEITNAVKENDLLPVEGFIHHGENVGASVSAKQSSVWRVNRESESINGRMLTALAYGASVVAHFARYSQ
jgi:hypothetical protein